MRPTLTAALPLACTAALIGFTLGCSPALDWREFKPAGQAVSMLLPCKPHHHERNVSLAERPVRLQLYACSAAGQTWALAVADTADPQQVGAALAALAASARANISGTVAAAAPLQVTGSTPHSNSQSQRLTGQLPNGEKVRMAVAVFAHGTRVFQATAMGPELSDEAAQTFMASIRFAS
jgi:hypothetical protein